MKAALYTFFSLILFSLSAQAQSEWIVAIGNHDHSPNRNRINDIPTGIEPQIMEAVAQYVGAKLTYVNLPVHQARKDFLKGKVTVACCLNKKWFPTKDAQDVSLFSAPIYRFHNIFIFPRGKALKVKTAKDLGKYRVGVIKGYNYPGQEHFGTRVDALSPLELLRMVEAGDVDVAIYARYSASFQRNKHQLKIEFGPLFSGLDLGMRIHKSHKEDLVRINQAIEHLKQSGTIKKIIIENVKAGKAG